MQANMKRPDPEEMFNKIDSDGDGSISESELTSLQENMTARSGQSVDLVSNMTDFDADGDGLLSQDEMGGLMQSKREELGPPPGPPGGMMSAGDFSTVSSGMVSEAYLANSGLDDQTSSLLDLLDSSSEDDSSEEDSA